MNKLWYFNDFIDYRKLPNKIEVIRNLSSFNIIDRRRIYLGTSIGTFKLVKKTITYVSRTHCYIFIFQNVIIKYAHCVTSAK